MNYLIRYSIYPSDKSIEEHLNNLKIKYNKSSGTKGEFIIFYIYDIDDKNCVGKFGHPVNEETDFHML